VSLRAWIAIGIAAVILAMGVAVKVQTSRLHAVQAEYTRFKADVAAAGREAQRRNEQDAKAREAVIQQREAEHATTVANLNARYNALARELRKPNPGSRTVPTLAAAAPVLACPDRTADLARRLDELETEVARLLARGDQAIADLRLCVGAWPK